MFPRVSKFTAAFLIAGKLSTAAYAGGVDIPSVNSVPLFYSAAGENPKYRDACFKAQEAWFLYIGLTQSVNAFNAYVTDAATKKVTTAIDHYTPLRSRDVYFGVGTAYAAIVKKQVTKTFRNPIFPRVKHTVSVGMSQQSITIQIDL